MADNVLGVYRAEVRTVPDASVELRARVVRADRVIEVSRCREVTVPSEWVQEQTDT
jgi:hypothetical protein